MLLLGPGMVAVDVFLEVRVRIFDGIYHSSSLSQSWVVMELRLFGWLDNVVCRGVGLISWLMRGIYVSIIPSLVFWLSSSEC